MPRIFSKCGLFILNCKNTIYYVVGYDSDMTEYIHVFKLICTFAVRYLFYFFFALVFDT